MSIKILIIDDDRFLIELVSHKLKKWGMVPYSASNIEQGLEAINSQEFDLVLLDLQIGEESGITVLKEIRKKWDQNHLPVIMISATQEDNDLVYTLSNGANDFVLKPINEAIFYARILTQLEHATLSKEYAQLKESEAVKALIVTCRHEFNNPLMIAGGTLSQIKKKYDIDEKYLSRLQNALDRVENLVERIGQITSDGNALEFDEYVKDVKKIKIS
jgi:DNA-binding response OmpR family regulator